MLHILSLFSLACLLGFSLIINKFSIIFLFSTNTIVVTLRSFRAALVYQYHFIKKGKNWQGLSMVSTLVTLAKDKTMHYIRTQLGRGQSRDDRREGSEIVPQLLLLVIHSISLDCFPLLKKHHEKRGKKKCMKTNK